MVIIRLYPPRLAVSIALSAADILDGIDNDRIVSIRARDNLQVKIARVNFEKRIELIGCDPRRIKEYKALGCFVEIIQSKTRVFLPRSKAKSIIDELAKAA